jgi:DNA-binding transcriptional LysR family regulator
VLPVRIKHIEVLHAIMVSGSLSGAAKLLNVSQPAVTQTLKHAEAQLGYLLFKRVRNRLVATQETLTLYGEVDKLFSQLQAVQALAANLRGHGAHELTILIPPSLSSHVLPVALKAFRRKFPRIALNIRALRSRDIVTAIALRDGDVGIVYGKHTHPSIEEFDVATGELLCVMPAAQAGRRATIGLRELSGLPVIRIHAEDPIGFVINDVAQRLGVEFVAGITVQTYQAALSLAEHGFGPALVDEFTVAGRVLDKLARLRVLPTVPIQLHALRHREGAEHTASEYLMRCVREVADAVVAQRTAGAG